MTETYYIFLPQIKGLFQVISNKKKNSYVDL